MTDAIIATTAGERTYRHPPNPHEGFKRRICESHYALCEGVSNIMVHPDVQGYCPRCKAMGIAWYLCTTCADVGYLCIPHHLNWVEAGLIPVPNHLATVAKLLAYHLKNIMCAKDRLASRHHFDVLLNIYLPLTNPRIYPLVACESDWGDMGVCLNCSRHGLCWQLCELDFTCREEGHVFGPEATMSLVPNPGPINWIAKLVADMVDQCPDFVSARRHFDYILDAFLSVEANIPTRAWLELKGDGNTTSKIAKSRAPFMGK